jgi:ABC-2 type transport system ATP-binding protein
VGLGRVTGFVGLDAPSEGTVIVGDETDGKRRRPLFEVGVMLEARSVHPGRSAYNHLLALAQSKASGVDVSTSASLRSVSRLWPTTGWGRSPSALGQRLGVATWLPTVTAGPPARP